MIELLVLFASVAVSLAVGCFVVMRDPHKLVNQVYGILTLAFIVLGVSNYLSLSPSSHVLAYMRLTVFATTISLSALYFLILLLLRKHEYAVKSKSAVLILIFTAIVACIDVTPLVFSGLTETTMQPTPIPEYGIILFIAHFLVLIVLCLRLLASGIRSTGGATRSQYSYILVGMIPVLLFAPFTAIILPIVFQQTELIFLSPLYVAFFVLMIAYSMIKHRLFDIRLAAVRSAVYIGVLITLSLVYYVSVYILSFFFTMGTEINPLAILIALLLGFLFQPVKKFFDKFTDRLFYRGEYDVDEFYAELNKTLTKTSDLRKLLSSAAHCISNALRSENVMFYIIDSPDKVKSAGTSNVRSKLPIHDIRELVSYVGREGDSVIQTDSMRHEERAIRRLLVSHKFRIVAPLTQYDQLVGFLCLSDRKSKHYTSRDIHTIDTIADSLVIAIQNAISIQQVSDLNDTLQQRIDDATKELRRSNAQLQRLDEAKDEFVSMASHQLRTPLTSVKGYIDMVLEGDAGEITDMQKHLLSEAFTSSERMVHLINDFLNVSRLQTGKFIVEKTKVDLKKLVEQEVSSLQLSAAQRQLTFKFTVKGAIPILMIDEGKMRQVVMNFLDNSLYYSRPSTVIHVRLEKKDDQVEFTVKDTGIGVPEKEQAHLFTKFYRASNARKQRPDGTGVGLFLAKKVITAHSGRMIFVSQEGKGSTFGYSLPVHLLLTGDRR